MHFQIPKPLHGWREFIGEVGIVVLGIVIALGAEQVAQAIHWRHEARLAQESIKAEIADHYLVASELVIAQPCIDRQLLNLEALLLKPGAYSPAPPVHTVVGDFPYQAPTRAWDDVVWTSAQSNGAVSHFDPDLRYRLSAYYSQLAIMENNARAVDLLAYRSRVLLVPIKPDAATRTNLIQLIEEARGHYAVMKLIGNQLLGQVEDMNMRPPDDYLQELLRTSTTLEFCRAHKLPLGSAEPQHSVAESVSSFEKHRHH